MKIHHFLTFDVKLSQASESLLLYLMPPTQDVNDSSCGRIHATGRKPQHRNGDVCRDIRKAASLSPKMIVLHVRHLQTCSPFQNFSLDKVPKPIIQAIQMLSFSF